MAMKTTHHLYIDVNGVLKMRESEFNRQFEGVVRDDNGRLMSVAEVRKYFEDARAKGHRVVPTTSECIGFDFQTGCPGHQVKELKEEIEEAMQARDWGRIERLANADLRHRAGSEPFDYLRHWCDVGRVFAYATNDYTWVNSRRNSPSSSGRPRKPEFCSS